MDLVIKCQNALCRFCDVSDVESRSRYLLLNESERSEVLRWVDLLATGLLVTIPEHEAPVQVDVELCTRQIRAVWDTSTIRRQGVAADVLESVVLPEIDALAALDVELSGVATKPQLATTKRTERRVARS